MRTPSTLLLFASRLAVVLIGTIARADDRPRLPPPLIDPEPTSAGSLHVDPDHGVSGEFGTWTVRYVIGAPGIPQGGGIRLQLSDAWHAGPRNSANRLQATDPKDDHYVSASASRESVRLVTVVEREVAHRLVKHRKRSLDGRSERYVFVVRIHVADGDLQEGDEIRVVYGDRSSGSRGYRAAAISTGPEPILVAVDSTATSRFRLHTSRRATLTARAGKPVELFVHLSSDGVAGKPLSGRVSLLDKESNPVSTPAVVRLARRSGQISVRETITLAGGHARFELLPRAAGIVRIDAEAVGLDLTATSNPARVGEATPERRIYWGDLHSHTHFSWDGVGDRSFEYARDVAALDFYAMTDHAMNGGRDGASSGLSHRNYDEYTALTDAHHAPGEFVTLHAYECSLGRPWGHHNIYFRGGPGPLFFPGRTSLPEIWHALRAGEALTIPHHTGKFPSGITFYPQNSEHRRNFEIYSGHGLSETFAPDHPLAFEKSDFTAPSTSLDYPSYFQDALREGLALSAIASTDDHRARPGQAHHGLVAAFARELTRESIFDALYERRTYATTGAKIILEVTVDGHPMGSIVPASEEEADDHSIRVAVVGTDEIVLVEILRYRAGDDAFAVAHRWTPHAAEFRGEHRDRRASGQTIYYVRVRQKNLVRGLPVMAWSSPVWISRP